MGKAIKAIHAHACTHTYKTPGILVCLSAVLMAFGTYLATVEVPVRITYDPAAAEQYDLMRAYLPFGFTLWILSLVFLVYGIVSGTRKPLAVAQLKKPFSMVNIIVGVAIGILALTSTFLPWVIAERTEPFIETRKGSFNVGQYHALTGVNLMLGINNMVGDIILLVLVGAIISVLHIPLLTLFERGRGNAKRAFLFLLDTICIIGPVSSIRTRRIWWISLRVNGTLGLSATSISLGIGSQIATICAVGLLVFGLVNTIKKMKDNHFLRTRELSNL